MSLPKCELRGPDLTLPWTQPDLEVLAGFFPPVGVWILFSIEQGVVAIVAPNEKGRKERRQSWQCWVNALELLSMAL